MALSLKQLSSLVKVFPDCEPNGDNFTSFSMLQNERFSFQVAFFSQNEDTASIELNTELNHAIELYYVDCVYSAHLTMKDMPLDDDVLKTEPGLYPDVLRPSENGKIPVHKGWNSIWISVKGKTPIKSGDYTISLNLTLNGETEKADFTLSVLDALLPEQTLINTNWFHADCLSQWYNEDVFSEAHWRRMEQYIACAAEHGQNMIYVPFFTPPLDTDIGGERQTVQLLDITRDGDGENAKYHFDFTKALRYMKMAERVGMRWFEIVHLFTQWGAAWTPKIIANVDGKPKRIFGWDVAADSDEYKLFLGQFIPSLKEFLKENNWLDRSYFHISDEPSDACLESYRRAYNIVKDMLDGCNMIDALSDYSFYEQGLVSLPIPSNDHIKKFLDNNVSPLWTYFCCVQGDKVCNRFLCMPSYRNRAFGYQLFVHNIAGFLQWGYNYWFCQKSEALVNPFNGEPHDLPVFPAGDAMIVYPGEDGPLSSIRQLVFEEALQDMRACQLLEKLTSKEAVEALIKNEANCSFEFDQYPKSETILLNLRKKINQELAK